MTLFFLAAGLLVGTGLGATLMAVRCGLEWPDLDESGGGATMSSYYVAGVPAGKVERMVKKATARQERRLKRCPTPESTSRRAEKHRARILSNPPREQISPEFDAPQFCREWIRLAEKSGFSHMVIVEPK